LRATADALAQLDVLAGIADLARRQGYCRPELTQECVLELRDARHPVLERMAAAGSLVPNDALAGDRFGSVLLVTGPNMAGKSTYIRQVALITIMAQMGSFVPAAQARIGVADRVFARVGASDELARGMSTFMVEMTETARILNTATARSLVILDEIGRGTSTYDGISLAWSIVEYIHDEIGCRTFFATHYHELTELDKPLAGVRNWNVAVREFEDHIVFLYKIVPGAADKSYGIHVAKLAGVPRSVTERAADILEELESDESQSGRGRKRPHSTPRRGDIQLWLFEPEEHPLLEEIRKLRLDETTALEALRKIHTWQEALSKTASAKS
jgi:DNA mismatch repair protein MutS